MTLENMHEFIDQLDVSDELKDELKGLRPEKYIGLAPELVKN